MYRHETGASHVRPPNPPKLHQHVTTDRQRRSESVTLKGAPKGSRYTAGSSFATFSQAHAREGPIEMRPFSDPQRQQKFRRFSGISWHKAIDAFVLEVS